MKLGILTCAQQPALYITDKPMIPAFAHAGIEAEAVVWNDPDVDWKKFDALLLRSTWDYYLDEATFRIWLQKIADMKLLMMNPMEVVRRNMHKFYLQSLEKKGVDIIPTIFLKAGTGLEIGKWAPQQWAEMVIKPAFSAGSYQTRRFSKDEVKNIEAEYQSFAQEHDMLIQPFMPEIEEGGECSLIFFEGRFQGGVVKKPARGDFRVQLQFGGKYSPFTPSPGLIEAAFGAIEAFGGNPLYARVDGVISNGTFLLMELELIEPDLYFSVFPEMLPRFVDAVVARLKPHFHQV